MGANIVLSWIVASVLLASTSARAADLFPLHSYEVDTPVIPETVIMDRPIVVEQPVVIERPVELRIIEEPILVSPYPADGEPDDDDDVLTIEEPY